MNEHDTPPSIVKDASNVEPIAPEPLKKRLKGWHKALIIMVLVVLLPFIAWVIWAERNPEGERDLRLTTYDWLSETFSEEMSLNDGWHGLYLRSEGSGERPFHIVLVHGLDEPGLIWSELMPALIETGYGVSELRYPNDHAIDRNTAYVASLWRSLNPQQPVIMIGHSMGGLLIREFVTLWRHPVATASRLQGASIAGAILIGTPNQGSELARLRIFTELLDQLKPNEVRELDWLMAVRDGTGAAKVDLRPDSEFLKRLNQRPWPPQVKLDLIAGVLTDQEALSVLGDGAVSLNSALLPDLVPEPHIVTATHRGLLRRYLSSMDPAPATEIVLQILGSWAESPDSVAVLLP